MMKRLFYLYTLLSLVGCTEVAIEDNIPTTSEEYYATIEDGNSRTYVDGQIRMRWTAEDRITLFEKNTYNRTFMFTGKTGANAGGFRKVSTDDDYWFGYDVDNNYAVYPHSNDNTLDETDLFLTVNMPAEQTYVENSFGLGANTMVAVSETGQLMFKNVGSYLRVRLYGNNTSVSSITLTNKGNEAIAGEAKVTPVINGEPTCVMTGSGKSIRLTCPTPVTISSDANNPTDFWIVVPPVTLASGFTITVENSDGKTQTYDIDKSFTFERNKYNNMVRELEIEDIPTIHVAQAGTLSSLISDENKYTITSLKLSGELNGDDIRLIREMAGGLDCNLVKCDNTEHNHQEVRGNLSELDLSEASVVSGGGWYFYSENEFYTSDNVIGKWMFHNCNNLQKIVLPKANHTFEMFAFSHNENLVSVTIPEGTTSIGHSMFWCCRSLSTITIPNSVTFIDGFAFGQCPNLTSIILSKNITSIGESTFSCDYKLSSITIPDNVTTIGEYAFLQCDALTSVVIPNKVEKIGAHAFAECDDLTSVTIGSSVNTIGGDTFGNSSNLKTITIHATTPPFLLDPCVEDGVILYVPNGCVETYNTSRWADYFKNIVEMKK